MNLFNEPKPQSLRWVRVSALHGFRLGFLLGGVVLA